ncbi:MAG: hypothetical protein Q8L90_03875 [Bacteroidota bacterium]|nr:hypothetical protein [Bacteroidota bacterium]
MKTNNQKEDPDTKDESFVPEKISTENILLFLNLSVFEKYSKQAFEFYSVMLGVKKWTLLVLLISLSLVSSAQVKAPEKSSRASISVLNIDTKGLGLDPVQMGNMVRIELEKLDTFQVMDRYDVSYVVEKNKLNISNCYGKICLVEIGKTINSDKMFTGSIELIGENIIATFRLIDVKSATIEKTQVNEFLNLPKELQSMVQISINQMFGKFNEQPLLDYVTKKNNFESSVNNHNKSTVNLSGPRSGFTYVMGEAGERLQASRNEGGYNSYPVMFQFGYQFEVQYLNEGNYQALFEFLPAISGFNQNVFLPSVTIMNGFRNNKHGWEIAFGPTFGLINKANGYYDADQNWQLESDWNDDTTENPYKIESRIDSRGYFELQAGFIVAAGKTIKSGKLNIPINIYVVPNKDGIRMGASFGFNAKKV